MEEKAVCLRKGAWSKEEDHLLTKCIHKHGEGRWHLVPLRAGVNRCRKSCRLRWLNYLSPNIKRGSFAKDEIDLIFRLHKLLGNRWSLIAGRIPGRTSNDVKNFWNTYIVDKKPSPPQVESIVTKSNNTIIKPRPRVFSRKPQVESITPDTITNQLQTPDEKNYKSKNNMLSLDDIDDDQLVVAQEEGENECMSWWSSLLIINENENMSGAPFLFPEDEPILPNHVISNHAKNIDHELSDIDLYADLWDFFSMDRITTID